MEKQKEGVFLDILRRKVINAVIDVFVLAQLWNKSSLSAYDVIALLNKKYHVLLSSGTVYYVLYRLERRGLLRGSLDQRKRIYMLTEQGRRQIKAIQNHIEEVQKLLKDIFSGH